MNHDNLRTKPLMSNECANEDQAKNYSNEDNVGATNELPVRSSNETLAGPACVSIVAAGATTKIVRTMFIA